LGNGFDLGFRPARRASERHADKCTDAEMRCLRCASASTGTRLDESQKISVILLLSSFVRSQATMEAQIDAAVRAAGPSDVDFMAEYGKLLSTLLDPQRFPELTAVAAAGVLSKADPWDDEFTFGLARILDGIEALVVGSPGPADTARPAWRARRILG
jgi:hypothetical protein